MKKTYLGISKPSEAIFAMVRGLRKAAKRKTFKINMGYFKYYKYEEEEICYGCAATCAIQELSGVLLKPDGYRTLRNYADSVYKVSKSVDTGAINEMAAFEYAMDGVRRGNLQGIFYFFDLITAYHRNIENTMPRLPYLATDTWRKGLPAYVKLAKQLAAMGY